MLKTFLFQLSERPLSDECDNPLKFLATNILGMKFSHCCKCYRVFNQMIFKEHGTITNVGDKKLSLQ